MKHLRVNVVQCFGHELTNNTSRVPTRTGEPGKWEAIFRSGKSQGISNRLEKSRKVTQNTGKQMLFVIFSDI